LGFSVRDFLKLRILLLASDVMLLPYYYFQHEPLWPPIFWGVAFITVNGIRIVTLPSRSGDRQLVRPYRAYSFAAVPHERGNRVARKARGANPAHPGIRIDLAAAYALEDKFQFAAAELDEARRLSGGDRFSSITHLKALPGAWRGVPKIRALFEATYFAGLRKAGMPEE
jgi:hypothetical protein